VASERSGAGQLFPSTAFSLLTERWRDLATHGQAEVSPATRQARRICGRWIRQRRCERGLDAQRLAAVTELDADVVALLELGLAGDDLVCDASRMSLCEARTAAAEEADHVAAIVEGALGRRDGQLGPIAELAAAGLRASRTRANRV
jgi:hypothetical protein